MTTQTGAEIDAEILAEAESTEANYVGYEGERGEPGTSPDTLGRLTYRVDREGDHETRTVVDVEEADVISSELPDGMHAPCFDIDLPIRAVESSTPDHWHLYIEKPMTWEQYDGILTALVAAGVVESGYQKASQMRGGTHLRLPWVRKPAAPFDA